MRICIIGSGYIGKSAAKMWKDQGHEITITARSLEKSYPLREIADLVYLIEDDWHDLLKKQDVVLLCVAPSDGDYIETYLRSAEKLNAGLQGNAVKQIIYTSSTSVYGDHQGQKVDEETTTHPESTNAQILLATEQLLQKAANPRRNVCVFRLGEIYGPTREIRERLKGIQGKTLSGTGMNCTNLCHLEEILLGLDVAVKNNLSGVYNLCNDIHIPRKELYDQICEEENLQKFQWDASKKTAHGGNKNVSNTKLKSAGWKPLNTY